VAAKAQTGEVYGVLAEEVVAHSHVGETPPCERVGCSWWSGSHCNLPVLRWLLHFRVATRHAHAERLLAKAGVARRRGRVSPSLKRNGMERKGRSAAEVCTSAARKIGEAPCTARSGQSPLSVLSTSVTNQIGDTVYSEARRLWFLSSEQFRTILMSGKVSRITDQRCSFWPLTKSRDVSNQPVSRVSNFPFFSMRTTIQCLLHVGSKM
jgi:hypothetical protein